MSKSDMANQNTKHQNFCKGTQRKISKEAVHRITEMVNGILITKKKKATQGTDSETGAIPKC